MAKSTNGTKNLKEALTPDQVSKVEDKYKSIYSGMLKGNKKKLMKYIDPKLKRPNPDAMAMGRAINLVKKETETVNEGKSQTIRLKKDLKIGGKSTVKPFSDQADVTIKKGQKYKLVQQRGSMGMLMQFFDIITGKKLGSAWIDTIKPYADFVNESVNEEVTNWPKELTSRYSDEYRFELEKVTPTYQDKPGRAKYRVIDIESGELKATPVFGKPEHLMTYADDLIKPQGGTQSTNLGESLNEYINPGYQIETKYFDSNEVKAVADQLQDITGIENIQYKEFKWADGTGGLSFTISSDYRDTGLDYLVRLEHTHDGKWKSKVFATYGAGASEVDFGEVDLNIDMEGFTNMKDITKETFKGVWDKMLRAAAPALKSKRQEMEAHQSKSNQSQRDFYKDRGQTSGTIDERLATLVKEVYSEKQRKWACSQDGPEFDEMCKDTAISKKKLKEERTSTVSKARAKSELKQMLKGKRDDGMGKSTLKAVLAIDKDGKEIKVKKLEDFDKFEKGTKFSLKETTMNNDRLTELIKSALTGPVKEESTPIKEGIWSMGTVEEINRFIKDIKEMKNHYYDIVGSDDVFDGLDRAERAAEEMMMNAPENIHDLDEGINEELATTPIKDDIYAIGSRIYKDPYEAISLVATDQTVVVRDFSRKDKKFKAAVMDYVKSNGLETSVDRDGLYIDTKPLDFKGIPLMNEKSLAESIFKKLRENKLVKEDNWFDYADIGQFSTPEKEWGKYNDKYFVLKGKEIVDKKYGGDVGKAYDTIVKGKTKDDGDVVGVDIAEKQTSKIR